MAQNKTNRFEVFGDDISIHRDGWPCVAMCTYREDYWEELTSHVWSMDKNRYPKNKTLGGGLHRYMMKKWYGDEALEEFTRKGYVVDHINNEHNDCRISNLEFLLHDYNTAKGHQLDKDIRRLKRKLAVSIFKDFYTGCYQLTIGCNDYICGHDSNGEEYGIDCFKLLYNGDYNNFPIVILDAEILLLSYEFNQKIDICKTKAACIRIYHSFNIQLTEEEKQQAVVTRSGFPFVVIGNGRTFIDKKAPDKEWSIPQNYDGTQIIEHMIPKLL